MLAASKASQSGSSSRFSRAAVMDDAAARSSASRPCAAKNGSPFRSVLTAGSTPTAGSTVNSIANPPRTVENVPSGSGSASGVKISCTRAMSASGSGVMSVVTNSITSTSKSSQAGIGRPDARDAANEPSATSSSITSV